MIDRVACPLTGIHEAVLLSPILPMHQKDVADQSWTRAEREVSSRGDVDPRLCPRPSEAAAHPGARGDKKREPGHVQSGGSRVSTRQDARRHSSLING